MGLHGDVMAELLGGSWKINDDGGAARRPAFMLDDGRAGF
jgi:hypothetical protein